MCLVLNYPRRIAVHCCVVLLFDLSKLFACALNFFFYSAHFVYSCSCMVVWSFVHISATYTPLAHGILNFRLLYWPRKKEIHTDWIHLENVWFVKMWQCGNVSLSTTETTTRKKVACRLCIVISLFLLRYLRVTRILDAGFVVVGCRLSQIILLYMCI